MLPNTYLPQVNFGHLTETVSPNQFRVDVPSHCNTKGNGHRKFREITEPVPYLSYLSGSFRENRGAFPKGKIPEKKEESLRFLGFFS